MADRVTAESPLAAGPIAADTLLAPWFACLAEQLPALWIFDAHTHIGSDPDGSRQTGAELCEALDLVAARAVSFPLSDPAGYRAANERVIGAAQESGGRIVAFCRVDPHDNGLAEAELALGHGAAGIKLHPRAERFSMRDAAVDRIAALANESRRPIIIHAGRGIPSLGADVLALAERHPGTPIVLAHAAVCDLAWIWRDAPSHPNLFFDTAWWNPADQLALLTLIPPGQILFGSDIPYGRTVAEATPLPRLALAAELGPEHIAAIAGGQLERLLSGDEPLDLGPATLATPSAPGPLLERVHTLLIAAIARMTTGQPADEYLELARLACGIPSEHRHARAAASVLDLLGRYEHYRASGPIQQGPRPPGIHLIFVAAAVARTPDLPLPTPTEGASDDGR